jgi:prepilin-type N-terminal cleavage/methylation domain-containing protein
MRRAPGIIAADQAGMSLPEILIACLIVGVGLAGLLSAIPTASYGIQEGRQLSTASFLANQRMEEVRSAQWTQCPAADTLGVSASSAVPPTAGALTTFPDETPMAAPYGDYSRIVRITSVQPGDLCAGGPNVGLRQVVVTVSYRPMVAGGVAADGTTKSAIVTMLFAQR